MTVCSQTRHRDMGRGPLSTLFIFVKCTLYDDLNFSTTSFLFTNEFTISVLHALSALRGSLYLYSSNTDCKPLMRLPMLFPDSTPCSPVLQNFCKKFRISNGLCAVKSFSSLLLLKILVILSGPAPCFVSMILTMRHQEITPHF